jgi:glucose/arabinose dehydrogenase
MAGTTSYYGWPYQQVGDAPNGAQGLQDLAQAVENTMHGNPTLGGNVTVGGTLTVTGTLIASGHISTTTYSGTTDASGFLTVTHGAGFTPVGGWAVTTNPSSSFALFWGMDTIGATTLRLRFMNASVAGPLVSLAVSGRLFVVRP